MMKPVKLSEFFREKSVKAESVPDYEVLPVLGVSNKVGITVTGHKKSKDLATYQLIEEGDFAYNPYRINVGSIGLTPQGVKGLVSPAYVVFSAKETLLPELLLNFLKSSEGLFQISKYSRGTVRKSLRFKDLCQISMFIPPIEKQRLILQQKEKIQNEEYALKREITHQQTLLKKLRQQILQEAVEGKLTADWRAQNPDVEPASELLARIQVEKAQLVKAKKISKQNPLPPISEEEKPFALPNGWVWCRLSNLCSKTGSGSTPTGGKSAYVTDGIKFIRSQNVYNEGLVWNGEAYITFKIHEKMKLTQLYPEDLLLNITGGSIGRCCILHRDFNEGNINQHVAIIRPVVAELGYYLHKVICSDYFQREIIIAQTGAGREGLPKNKMDIFLIPLPPLPEQKAIVAKVEKLLSLCDQLEHEISQNQCHAEQLMQAVLSEAFSQPSEQTTQPAAVPIKRVMKQGELFLKLPAAQTGISPLLLQAEQQGFYTEAPSFPCSSL